MRIAATKREVIRIAEVKLPMCVFDKIKFAEDKTATLKKKNLKIEEEISDLVARIQELKNHQQSNITTILDIGIEQSAVLNTVAQMFGIEKQVGYTLGDVGQSIFFKVPAIVEIGKNKEADENFIGGDKEGNS